MNDAITEKITPNILAFWANTKGSGIVGVARMRQL